jgi:hypothetical protein
MMKTVVSLLAGVVILSGGSEVLAQSPRGSSRTKTSRLKAETAPPAIEHVPLRCVKERENPIVKAGVVAKAELQKNRVYFKAHQHPDWYYVDMRALKTPDYAALLPQPLAGTRQIDYYVQALDVTLQASRTDEYGPEVTRSACRRDVVLPKDFDRGIVIGGTKAGQPSTPPGFSKAGIVAFITVAGVKIVGAALSSGAATAATETAAASAGATTGGGVSTGVLVGGGVAAGSAAVLGVVLATGGEGKKEETPFTGVYSGTWLAVLDDDCVVNGSAYPCRGYMTYVATLNQESETIKGQLSIKCDIQECCTWTTTIQLTGTVDGLHGTIVLAPAEYGCTGVGCSYHHVFEGNTIPAELVDEGRVLRLCRQDRDCWILNRQ